MKLCCLQVYIVGIFGGFGVTGGAHRLWTHRAYKAKLPLRIILLVCFSASGQVIRITAHKLSDDSRLLNAQDTMFARHLFFVYLFEYPIRI